jgi:hypothetical protein
VAEVAEFTVTLVTLAPSELARGKLAKAVMAASNVLPFCRRLTFCETGVLELKNFSQFAVICALALPPAALGLLGAAELAAGELAAGDEAAEEAAGVLDAEVVADGLALLLQAATARAKARASAGARVIRRAKSLNRMTRLLSLGRMHG